MKSRPVICVLHPYVGQITQHSHVSHVTPSLIRLNSNQVETPFSFTFINLLLEGCLVDCVAPHFPLHSHNLIGTTGMSSQRRILISSLHSPSGINSNGYFSVRLDTPLLLKNDSLAKIGALFIDTPPGEFIHPMLITSNICQFQSCGPFNQQLLTTAQYGDGHANLKYCDTVFLKKGYYQEIHVWLENIDFSKVEKIDRVISLTFTLVINLVE